MQIEITHSIEKSEVAADGGYDFFYNFLDYVFVGDDFRVTARTYTDDIHSVAIRGQTSEKGLPRAIFDYLRERFDEIRILGDAGYRPIDPASITEITT